MSTAGTDLGERLVCSLREGALPRPARLAAARGALPLEPERLASIQVLLLADQDAEVREAAQASLAALPAETARALAELPGEPEAATWLAGEAARFPEAALALARQPGLPVEAAARLLDTAAAANLASVLEALALNHETLGRAPDLAHRLAECPALPEAARPRLLDLLDELAKAGAEGAAPAEPTEEEEPSAPAVGDEGPPPAKDPFLAALGVDAEVEALLPELGLDLGHLADRSELLGEAESEDEERLIARLAKMNVGQKLKVALFGTREERSILIRDSNRVVATAVVKNPKFTEQEAEAISNSRNVCDEVLRLVARHRDFGKNYQIQHNLVRNPRCPVEIAMNFVTRLNDKDLKLLLKNRNVSEAVRRQAKRIIEAREARRRVRLRTGKH